VQQSRCDRIEGSESGRKVGKLHCSRGSAAIAADASSSSCTARPAGALSGGYRADDPDGTRGASWLLVGDVPDLEQLPDAALAERTASRYAIYWPRADATPKRRRWQREGQLLTYEFCQARYEARAGKLTLTELNPSGWTFRVTAPPDRDPRRFLSTVRTATTTGNSGSLTCVPTIPGAPDHRSASCDRLEKVTQVLADALLRQIADQPSQRKLVAFTDSRQDAAKLAAGLEKRHFEDAVRQLLINAARVSDETADLAAFEAWVGGRRDSDHRPAYERFVVRYAQDAEALRATIEGYADDAQRHVAAALRARISSGLTSLVTLRDRTEQELLAIGMNPGGPDISKQHLGGRDDGTRWTALYDLSAVPPRARPAGELDTQRREWLDDIRVGS